MATRRRTDGDFDLDGLLAESDGDACIAPDDPTDSATWLAVGQSDEVSPSAALSLAVLRCAVDDVQSGAAMLGARGRITEEKRRAMRDAVAWFLSGEERWPWSFRAICDRHGIDPDDILARLEVRRWACRAKAADWFFVGTRGRRPAGESQIG